MLQITIKNQHILEKKYILSVLFNDFLGLDYQIKIDNSQSDFKVSFKDKHLLIKDGFFNLIKESYLKIENIPNTIKFNDFLGNKNLPILFGDNSFTESKNEIKLGLDIFASSFFMLTRWEEYVIKTKDKHNRFPTSESLAFKYNFHRRPIVNEYLELLWKMLLKLGVDSSIRKKKTYKIQFSHDIDHPLLFTNFKGFIKQTSYQILKKCNFKQGGRFINHYISYKKDPYDTFDLLMDISENNNSKSQFNIMNCSKGKFDEGYNTKSDFNQKLLKKIKERGHLIGFHPSYNSYNSSSVWKKEKEDLEENINQKITKGRQHYLRFENPVTWQILEENKMEEDSTLGFHDNVGFRSGICYSYHPYDIIKRKKLNILESPLILMEGALIDKLNMTPNEFIKISNQLKTEVRKYNGTYTVLWHNSSFFLTPYPNYEDVLNELF